MKRYKVAQADKAAAEAQKDESAAQAARDALEALILFKGDMGAFIRLYAFLSQIFGYGNTDIEKRFMFYKRLIPLLEFGRERVQVDLSKVTLTHHSLSNTGTLPLHLDQGDSQQLPPMNATGSGSLQEKQKALLEEIIQMVN
ncbi:hypothetical protein [Asaia sp. HN010]|uniref:hypothetical protein n=1 Tax=Asaia sp. HN010 TaxID=3081233 RepID=UPI003018A57A